MVLIIDCCYAECYLCCVSFMLSVRDKPILLSIILLNVVMLSVRGKPIMLSDILLNVVMLSVGAPNLYEKGKKPTQVEHPQVPKCE
jgi:hypothetical protein